MVLKLKDNTEITVSRITREFSERNNGKIILSITIKSTDMTTFNDIVKKCSEKNIETVSIIDDNETSEETFFTNCELDNIMEYKESSINDITIRLTTNK